MPDTWLDRAIAWISPKRGVQRAQARSMMQALGYEGARQDRRTAGWSTTAGSADSESRPVATLLRQRARDLVRNNPYAARALEVKVANTIGAGIVAEVKGSQRLSVQWERFVETCDADGNHDLYGLQALTERCRVESGECLIRFVQTGDFPDPPTQLRVLEPDFLDSSRDFRGEGENVVRDGLERDSTGRVVAYWIFRDHPGEATSISRVRSGGMVSDRVPAEDVIHVYWKQRPGQMRGVTEFAPVMLRARDLDDYDDAWLMRRKVEACISAYVTSPEGASATKLGPVSTDENGRIERISPGTIVYGGPGDTINYLTPSASSDYAEFERFGLRAIAAGVGVPYELMTGDLSQVNYSSYRAGLVDFRRRVEQIQWLLYVQQVCSRIWERFLGDVRTVNGGAGARTSVDWTPPRFELIDPLKETQAEIEAAQAGFDPLEEIARKRGWTLMELLDKIESGNRELDRRKLVLKSDFRQIAKQAAAPASEDDRDDSEDREEPEAA